jgi:O-antigen ligase
LGGAILLFSLEWVLGLMSYIKKGARPRSGFLFFLVPVVLGGASLVFLAKAPESGLPGYLGAGVFRPHKDASGQIRIATILQAVKLFKKHPIFGTGPGVAGAEAVVRGMIPPSLPGSTSPPPSESPLSNNLYTEVLSEWGVLGTLLWLVFGALLLAPMPWGLRLRWVAALGLVFITSETLPRFDLWLNLLVCVSLCRNPENLERQNLAAS